MIVLPTSLGVRVGLRPKIMAAAPAMWGEAIDVPEIVLIASGLPIHAAVIVVPGPKISTHLPQLLKEEPPNSLIRFLPPSQESATSLLS